MAASSSAMLQPRASGRDGFWPGFVASTADVSRRLLARFRCVNRASGRPSAGGPSEFLPTASGKVLFRPQPMCRPSAGGPSEFLPTASGKVSLRQQGEPFSFHCYTRVQFDASTVTVALQSCFHCCSRDVFWLFRPPCRDVFWQGFVASTRDGFWLFRPSRTYETTPTWTKRGGSPDSLAYTANQDTQDQAE